MPRTIPLERFRNIGILANQQGVIFSAEAQKATQFIQLANRNNVPLVDNTTSSVPSCRHLAHTMRRG